MNNRDQQYRDIVKQLVQCLSSSGIGHSGNAIAIIGLFIVLSKKGQLINYIGEYRYIYSTRIWLDSSNYIRLQDVCALGCMSSIKCLVLDVTHIMHAIHNLDHAKLFDEIIAYYNVEEAREIGIFSQPQELTHLITYLLNDTGAKNVYNPFAGIASYQFNNKSVRFVSQEINYVVWIVGQIRFLLNDIDAEYTCDDSLEHWLGDSQIFDAVVATPPFGMRLDNNQRSKTNFNVNFNHKDIDPLFIDKALKSVRCNGLVISVVAPNFLSSGGDLMRFREFLVMGKYIQKVILLPRNIFHTTPIYTAIILLSRSQNDHVLFVDASQCAIEDKRINILDSEQVIQAIESEDSKIVRKVLVEEIAAQSYDLTPKRYFLEKERVPEGYKLISLQSVAQLINGINCVNNDVNGHYVSVGELSSDALYFSLNIEDLPYGKIKAHFKRITTPVLLLSMIRSLKPSYVEASEEQPIYISPGIMALSIDLTLIEISFLAYELSLKSEILHKRTIFLNFRRRDILTLNVAVPSRSTQKEIIRSLVIADKNAKIKEQNLGEIIEMKKQELFGLISHRKHRINPYFSGIQDGISLLKDKFKEHGSLTLDHKVGKSSNIGRVLDNIEKSLCEMKEIFRDLTSELIVGEKTKFNLIDFLNSYNYIVKNTNLTLRFEKQNDGSIVDSDRQIEFSKSSLKELLDIILENAERHAFVGRTTGNIDIRYGEDRDGIYIQILNDGVPLGDNFNEELSFVEGYKYGDSGNTGKGLFRAKQICTELGASISWFNDSSNIFPTGLLIFIKDE